jgi:ribosomal protein L32
MGALPKRRISTARKGKRQAGAKLRFLRSVRRQLTGVRSKNENAV